MKLMMNIKALFASALCLTSVGLMSAGDFIAIERNGNIYDQANAKYITVNQNNEDIAVVPGMVFESSQHVPGWYKVEYSPGLHAYIPDQITAKNLKPVAAGSYNIKNQPGRKISTEGNGESWKATVDGQTYKGEKIGEILIFFDNNGVKAFSIVDTGDGPVAITYDNSVTKFF